VAVLLEADADLGLGVGALGDRVHLEQAQGGRVRHDLVDGVEHRVDRTVAGGFGGAVDAVDVQRQLGRLALGAGDDPQVLDLDLLRAAGQGVVDQGDDVVVVDVLLAVGQVLEAAEGLVQGVLAQVVAQAFSFSRKAWRPECLPMTRLGRPGRRPRAS
jgi:hypothetical protein